MNLHGLVQIEGVDNFVELDEEVSTLSQMDALKI